EEESDAEETDESDYEESYELSGIDDDPDLWQEDPRATVPPLQREPDAMEIPSIWLNGFNVKAKHYYAASLVKEPRDPRVKGDNGVLIIFVDTIEKGPTGRTYLHIIRHFKWRSLYPSAPHNALLMGVDRDNEPYERRLATSLTILKEDISIEYGKSPPSDYFCYWAYRYHREQHETSFIPLTKVLSNVPQIHEPFPWEGGDEFWIADLFSGVGGSSCGFKAAGFKSAVAVEKDYTKVHQESVEAFLEHTGKQYLNRISVLLMSPPCQGFSSANSGGKDDASNCRQVDTVSEALRVIQPRYL
ncbi:1490_t:CDS:2, partial [Acaulospora colombiana]